MAKKNIQKNVNGFTLLEIMIALFIFSVLAILSMRGIKTTYMAKEKSQLALDQLAELETAYVLIQKDLEQIINRNVFEPSGGIKLSFLMPIDNLTTSGTKSGLKDEFGYNRLEFSRTGNNTTMLNQRVSDLLRVAYYQNEDKLIRHSWRQIDPTKNTLVDKRRLLTHLEQLDFYFIDNMGRKSQVWQPKPAQVSINPSQPTLELPRGIIMNFKVKQYGNIEWLFILPEVLNKA
ncbi:MAG: type II secretion system minor pseudopilin GspJ [Gammaproteobacteria bacterium]|nr:type II secretion system minor pseudopilin GspJ [Gammaproteobacteria bacterium]